MRSPPGIDAVGRLTYGLVAMSRPAYLLGTVPLYLVGVASAFRNGYDLDASAAVLGLATVWAVQAMTHYNNEYWDVGADRIADSPSRVSGGSGVLVDRTVPRQVARIAALGSLAVALALALASTLHGDAGTAFLGIVVGAVLLGWLYSSPPVRLVGRGVGEVVVAGVVGGLVPAVGYLLQASTIDASFALPTLPLVPLAFATAIATALPDVPTDREAGKRTLPVRVGTSRAVLLDGLLLLVGWLLYGYVATRIRTGVGGVAATAFLLPLGAFAMSGPGSVRGSTADAERLAMATLAALGWASVSLCVLLVVW